MSHFGVAVLGVLAGFFADLRASVPGLAVSAVAFSVIGVVAARCNDTPPWWRKPDLPTDLAYMVAMPCLMHYVRLFALVLGFTLMHGVAREADLTRMAEHGLGPLAALPFAAQVVIYLLLSDLFLYWMHRLFHNLALWRYHAVHHSSEHLEWTSSFRFHPVDFFIHSVLGDILLLLAGISPAVLVFLVPFTVGMSGLTHANADWTWGPFRWLLASPIYHRWHHTGVDEGGERNFAANFPIFDILFGTYYDVDRDRRPARYGVRPRDVPNHLGGQMLYPFRARRLRKRRPAGQGEQGRGRAERPAASGTGD